MIITKKIHGVKPILMGFFDPFGYHGNMDRDKLIQEIKTHPEIAAVLLFGSQASGQATQDSDIDLAILYDRKMVPDELLFFNLEKI